MGDKSKIEWTDATWQVTHGCRRVSPGCENCYAERVASSRLKRLKQYADVTDEHGRWNGKVTVDEAALEIPQRWTKPRRIFVDSMSDLFHEDVPTAFIWRTFDTMRRCPQHQFQVLTKRAARMREVVKRYDVRGMPEHIWIGVSVEDQQRADERIPHLHTTPAEVRFLSVEPMLGPIEFMDPRLNWVVFGCESIGPRLGRPCDVDWIRFGLEQCAAAGIAPFVKQIPINGRLSKNMDEWPEDLRVREYPS